MTKIMMFSAVMFDVCNPRACDIFDVDIAHHLSLECRWSGATYRHYSVAEHSLWVAQLVPDWLYPHALLHDAHEAYLKDIPAPWKVMLGPWYENACKRIQKCVHQAFRLSEPSEYDRSLIHVADLEARYVEAEVLTAHVDFTQPGFRLPANAKIHAKMLKSIRQRRTPEVVEREMLKALRRICG